MAQHFDRKRSKIRLSRDLCLPVKMPRESATSNGSSLMIDAGEESDYESLKEFYQDQSCQEVWGEGSEVTWEDGPSASLKGEGQLTGVPSTDDVSHLFPKKFLRSKRGKPSLWSEGGRSGWSWEEGTPLDQTSQFTHISHVRIEPSSIQLYSAKLVHSYIGEQSQ